MRAAVASEEGVNVAELDDPDPGPDEAVVRVEACSLNHSDLWTIGRIERGEADGPHVPGSDAAGVVEAVGDGAGAVAPGDRVVVCPNLTCGVCRRCREGPENLCEEYGIWTGGFAERCVVSADRLVPLPDGVSFGAAAALPISYMTARHMLRRAGVGSGDLVFVPGATGGVGVAGTQLTHALGGAVVGTTRSPRKADRLRDLGVEHVIESDDAGEIREAVTAVGPVDATLNHLGGPFTDLGLSVLRRGGTVVVCGRTAGGVSEIDVRDLFWEGKRVIGSTMGTQTDLETLVGLVADGSLDPVVDRTYPLEAAGDAFDAMRERSLFGKLIVEPGA